MNSSSAKKTNNLKPNKKFYSSMFLFNFVIAAIEFGIIALVSFLSDKHIAGYIVCGVIFIALSAAFNLFVVRRSNLKTVYFIYGLAVNTAVCAIPTALIALLA